MSPAVTQDMSLFHLIGSASLLVQLVMLLLLLASFLSWWYIFRKLFVIREAIRQSDEFENVFWKGTDLNALFQSAAGSRHTAGSMERIFEAGFREFMKHKRQPGTDITTVMDSTRRAMRATYQREMDNLESHLSFLATVGSVSPYVGLFGTVWGIMNSFRGLSNVTQATIAHVAPGIAEALIATAMGLFAAIPAVIAYNRYSSRIDRLATRFESFMEELSNVLQRQASG
ncbi:Cell division and transport-associated protein TolQ [Nitrosospira sp. Nsp11]|jgi:TolQ protein|uniref:protein TolQ n=1 Tax=unclassified Nitrosospira TaxID=2609267 RepID=UPI000883A428|nr:MULTISPECIES: protein TolQ [unclassified Nitrosospira]SDA16764.1 Cell division and transport-associated protein TolQ [Nitrosospira sp. Nsp18]SHL92951.1 Cell division and transport-associated protein TolQ [Nitrosospira sp. Nsp11]